MQDLTAFIALLFILFLFASPLVFFYFRNKHRAKRRTENRAIIAEPIVKTRPVDPNELVLGWASGEEDETLQPIIQLKGVPQEFRNKHFYVVGGSGSGKTKFLESLIVQDIQNGLGFGVLDPHGDFIEDIKGYLFLAQNEPGSAFLREKVILIDPTDKKLSVGFNPLEMMQGISSAQQAGELVLVFKKIWEDAWGARMEDLLRNTLIALAENELTLIDLPVFLINTDFRLKTLEKVEHPICQNYFKRFNALSQRVRDEWMESTLNKVNAFLSDERIRVILSSPKSTFNLRDIIDTGKILLVKLDKGDLKGGADLLGSLILSKIQMAAFSRTNTPQSERRLFYLYIDEFQNYATDNFVEMLAEARKYRLSLIMAHQNLTQLPIKLRDSLFSNCGLQALFHLSRMDAQILAKEALISIYAQPSGWEDLIQLLQQLEPMQFAVKNTTQGGAVLLMSQQLPAPYEQAEMEERKFQELVSQQKIGDDYIKKRSAIKKAHEKLIRQFEEKEEAPQAFSEPLEVAPEICADPKTGNHEPARVPAPES